MTVIKTASYDHAIAGAAVSLPGIRRKHSHRFFALFDGNASKSAVPLPAMVRMEY